MKVNGFYKISSEYIEMLNRVGGIYKDNKERPFLCAKQDNNNEEIYWLIPTSNIAHRSQERINRIEGLCSLPVRDIRSCYFHIGHTNKPAIYKISNAIPVTDDYVVPYFVNRHHLFLRDKQERDIIEHKLKRILFTESRHPNKFEQHISDLYNHLVVELGHRLIKSLDKKKVR